VVEVEVTRDYEALTCTGKITLPKKVKWQGETSNPLQRGDAVKVWLGYDGDNVLAFCGYITTIGAKTPVVVTCEDEMWRLKTTPTVKKAYKSATIKQILDDQNLSYKIVVFGEQGLGAYRVTVDNVAELLNEWKEQGIRSFFKYDDQGVPTLYCGVIFEKQGGHVQVFNNHSNMVSDDGLTVQSAKDVKIKVKAISLDANNKKIKVEVGDADGQIRTLYAYGKTEAELKPWAEQELVRLKRDGLVGSFDTFGAFLVDRLDTIGVILDDKKLGLYQVKKDVITYGTGGFRQKIDLGDRMDGASD